MLFGVGVKIDVIVVSDPLRVVQNPSRELEEFSIVRCLTGWIPELLPLK